MTPHPLRTIAPALLAALLLSCTGHARAQAQAPGDARVAGFLEQLQSHRTRLAIAGLSVAIVEDGDILAIGGYGHADVERGVPATADTPYHIASITKTFTAILALRLAEQGKLDLEAPVSRWVPEITDQRILVRHLLSHTSEGTPGEKFNYNPDRFEHLKAIIESVAGRPLRLQIVETFLDPLAMHDSVPGPDLRTDTSWPMLGAANLARYPTVMARVAQPYTSWGDGEIVRSTPPPDDFWASAGLVSTVRDLAKYDAAIDRHALLGKAMQARAWTPMTSSTGEQLAQGLGWFVTDYRGERLVWHFGHWGTGFSAMYLKIPARRLSLILLANSENLADHHYKIGEDVTHDLFACSFLDAFVPELSNGRGGFIAAQPDAVPTTYSQAPSPDCALTSQAAFAKWLALRKAGAHAIVPLDESLVAAYAGRYQFPSRIAAITREGKRLFLEMFDGSRAELFARSPTQLFLKSRPWTLTFVREGGRVTRIDIEYQGEVTPARRVD